MPPLNQVDEKKSGIAGAQHILLIAQTKMGKSRWLAEAARDGYEILYADRDNGYETLKSALADSPAAQARIHYVNPLSMADFVEMVVDFPIFRYNETTRKMYALNDSKPDDMLIEVRVPKMGRNVIFTIDTLTSAAWDMLNESAGAIHATLADVDKYPREIYGKAGFRMTKVLKALQAAPFNVVAQAHPAVFEKKEKPEGMTVEEVKEKHMIIIATIDVPMSTSPAHGEGIGKYFNQIGWIELDAAGQRKLSFKLERNRISGGSTVDTKGDPMSTHRFSALFGKPPIQAPVTGKPWIRYITVADYKAELEADKAAKAAAAPRLGNSGIIKPPASVAAQNKPIESTPTK